jgi:hypothetical protein
MVGSIKSKLPALVDIFSNDTQVTPKKSNNLGKKEIKERRKSYFSAPLGLSHASRENTSNNESDKRHMDSRLPSNDEHLEVHFSPKDCSIEKPLLSPAPNLVRSDDSESDGDNLLQLKISQIQEKSILEIPHSSINSSDVVERFVHQPTADGHFLVNSQPLDTPMEGIKYSLTNGYKAMPLHVRNAVSSSVPKTRPNVLSASQVSIASPVALVEPYKIFLLLILPKSKIFEIIQVLYSPSNTTVRNLLDMIPINATEPALGSQEYSSLCRPKDGIPIKPSILASSQDKDNAGIVRGEMLVAIPKGYSGSLCARISTPILSNPKVRKLLERSDPLAPKRKKRRSARRIVEIETVLEETDTLSASQMSPFQDLSQIVKNKKPVDSCDEDEWISKERYSVRRALQSAAKEAASTNSQVEDDKESIEGDTSSLEDIPVEMWKTSMSVRSTYTHSECNDCASSVASFEHMTMTSDANSYGSLDAEFLSSLKRMPRKTVRPRRKKQREGRSKIIRHVVLVMGAMTLRYIMIRQPSRRPSEGFQDLFGLFGVIQVALVFLVFVKIQRFLQGKRDFHRCPFCKLILQYFSNAKD